MKKVKNIIYLIILFVLASNCYGKDFKYQSGDLLFQINEANDFTDAITGTTGDHQRFSFSHVAIVSVENDSVFVIEAVPKGGVQKNTIKEFLNGSAHNTAGKPLVVVKRLTESFRVPNAVLNAKKYLGLPYNSSFYPNSNSFYCSELVYESYLDAKDKHIFTSAPMSFRDTTGQISPLWIKYFKKLGKDIPEGLPGTSPNDMAKEAILVEVYRYF